MDDTLTTSSKYCTYLVNYDCYRTNTISQTNPDKKPLQATVSQMGEMCEMRGMCWVLKTSNHGVPATPASSHRAVSSAESSAHQ